MIRRTRTTALTILVILIALLAALVGPAVRSAYVKTGERIAPRQELALRLREQVTALHRPVERAAAEALDTQLLPSGSDAIAVAALQARLSLLAQENRAALASIEALPPTSADGLRLVGLRAQLATDSAGLTKILHSIEFGRPAIQVTNLSVRSRSGRAVGIINPLDVQIDLVGFKPEGGTDGR